MRDSSAIHHIQKLLKESGSCVLGLLPQNNYVAPLLIPKGRSSLSGSAKMEVMFQPFQRSICGQIRGPSESVLCIALQQLDQMGVPLDEEPSPAGVLLALVHRLSLP